MNFRFLILSVIWLILIASIFSSKAEILEEHPTLALSGEMSIDNRLQVLLQLSDQNIGKAIKQIQPLYDVIDSLNAAEQHVLIQIMLKGALNDNDLLNATNQMERIKALEKTIPESQLAQPIFYRSHLIFASIYAAQGDYKNGYLEKIEFSKKYNEFNKKEKDKAVAQLNQKYETEKKVKINELLESQNKHKELQLQAAVSDNDLQKLNILLFIGISIFLLLLYLRQLHVRKKLILLTKTDTLTKLINRRALFEQGNKLVDDAKSINAELSVIVLDLDDFKKINDVYGHNIGDRVLQQLALLGCETMRSRDIFARLGGEEFVAVLPDANGIEAKAIAERLKEKMSEFDFSHINIHHGVTLSLGIASLKQINLDFDSLLHAADQAMYRAKALGKNQVAIYHESMEDDGDPSKRVFA